MTPLFDIIVVTYGDAEKTYRCLDSIEENSSDYRLIWLDNEPGGLFDVRFQETNLVYLPFPENIGWVKAVNVGIALSTAPYVVICNDDIEIADPRWLQLMASAITDRVGIVGPRTNTTSYQGRYSHGMGIKLVAPKLKLTQNGIGNFPIAFFCTMVSRECLVDVGYLDEGIDVLYGDDDDWLARAHLKGWHMAIHTDVLVKHEHGAAKLDREYQLRNQQYLIRKWSKALDKNEDIQVEIL